MKPERTITTLQFAGTYRKVIVSTNGALTWTEVLHDNIIPMLTMVYPDLTPREIAEELNKRYGESDE